MADIQVSQLHRHLDSMGTSQWRSIRRQLAGSSDISGPLTPENNCTRNDANGDDSGYPPLPRKKKQGRKVLHIVGGWLARNNTGRVKKPFHSLDEPLSPATVANVTPQMSRTNSVTSRDNTEPETEAEEDEVEAASQRKRVSFDLEVTTVIIQQMDKEDLRNTFYTRKEFFAFKHAYRTHRDTPDWTRENDGLPCSCRSCTDDGAGLADADPPPESPPVSPPSSLLLYTADYEESDVSPVRDMQETGHEAMDQERNSHYLQRHDEPPSPVGATFGDFEDNRRGRRPARESGLDALITRTQRGSHARKISWQGNRVSPNVRQAVKKYGEEYAYKRLRLQGFSDRYIRTHFLPEGRMSDTS